MSPTIGTSLRPNKTKAHNVGNGATNLTTLGNGRTTDVRFFNAEIRRHTYNVTIARHKPFVTNVGVGLTIGVKKENGIYLTS